MNPEHNIRYDNLTILLYAALVSLGWLNIYASVYGTTHTFDIWDLSFSSGRQLVFIGTSGIIIFLIYSIDVHFFEKFAYVFYALILLLLFLVPFIGKEVGGNKAWIGIGSLGVQPSEFAKFIAALAVARYIGATEFKINTLKSKIISFLLVVAPMCLIFLQKDTGTALVFVSFLVVFFREGLSPWFFIVGFILAVVCLLTLFISQVYLLIAVIALWTTVILFGKRSKNRILIATFAALALIGVIEGTDYGMNHILKPHQRNRILSLVHPESDPLGVGWNVTQSKIAIGSGGFFGKGFLEGTQTQFEFVPEQSTDFIFCTVSEEHGWLGCLAVIGLFVSLFLRIIYLAERQKNRYARAYAYSVFAILFFHFTVNIGMTIGLFPVIGIPLPFLSYGGSSLWGFTILLFILLKLDAHRGQMLQRL